MNEFLTVAGFILSAVAIPLTYILARRGRKRPYLRYAFEYEQILTSEKGIPLADLIRLPSGDSVEQISRTYFAIWNHQGDTVRGADVLPNDPLRIQLRADDRMLRVRIVSSSRKQIGLTVRADEQASFAVIGFDFLDSNDGGIFEIIHQGSRPPYAAGTIRGAEVANHGKQVRMHDELDSIAASRLKRPWIQARRLGLIGTILTLVMSTMPTALGGMLLYMGNIPTERVQPKLVEVSPYDLTAIDGQRNFARAVYNYIETPEVPTIFGINQFAIMGMVVILFGIGMASYALGITRRAALPRRIVAIRGQDTAEISYAQSKPPSEPQS